MDFFKFPVELQREILIAAVQARGIKRALRLRLVSHVFAATVTDAVFASGILRTLDHQRLAEYLGDGVVQYGYDNRLRGRDDVPEFWVGYLAWRVVRSRRDRDPTAVLRTLQQVAERIDLHRGDAGGGSDVRVAPCTVELCRVFLRVNAQADGIFQDAQFRRPLYELHVRDEAFGVPRNPAAPPLDERDVDFGQALLSAAAYLDELELVQKLVAEGVDVNYRSIFGKPMAAAAYGNSVRCASALLSMNVEWPRGYISKAIRGSSTEVLAMLLKIPYTAGTQQKGDNRALLHGLHDALSSLSFECFRCCYEHFLSLPDLEGEELRGRIGIDNMRWRELERRLLLRIIKDAAGRGDVDMVSYMLDRCGSRPSEPYRLPTASESRSFEKPVLQRLLALAARHGRYEAIRWFIEKKRVKIKLPPSPEVARNGASRLKNEYRPLTSAAKGGSLRAVELILAEYDGKWRGVDFRSKKAASSDLKRALKAAVEREHDSVVQRLGKVACEFGVDTSVALGAAMRLGLESMVVLLSN